MVETLRQPLTRYLGPELQGMRDSLDQVSAAATKFTQ